MKRFPTDAVINLLTTYAKTQKQKDIIKRIAVRYGIEIAAHYARSFVGGTNTSNNYVTAAKERLTDSRQDKLADKLAKYGNNGSYISSLAEKAAESKFAAAYRWLMDTDRSKPLLADIENTGKLVSIEIECMFNSKVDAVKSIKKMNELNIPVTGKYDGSLRTTKAGQQTIELVLTFKQGDYYPLLKLCEALKGHASVNASCGLHVHFDQRGKTYNDVLSLADKLAQVVPALKQMLPKSRRQNQYCRYNHNSTDRYSFINSKSFARHKTLEVRGHSGTIDYYKIVNWVKIMAALADMPITQSYRSINTLSAAMLAADNTADTQELVAWMKYRAALFASDANDAADYQQAA